MHRLKIYSSDKIITMKISPNSLEIYSFFVNVTYRYNLNISGSYVPGQIPIDKSTIFLKIHNVLNGSQFIFINSSSFRINIPSSTANIEDKIIEKI